MRSEGSPHSGRKTCSTSTTHRGPRHERAASRRQVPLKRPRALTLVALGGALLAATLSFGTGVAHAAYSAHVRAGTLEIDGNAASDKLSLRLAPGAPNILQLDVGEDGTADFSFDRSTFTAIAVDAGRGDDEIRIDQSGGPFTDEAITLNGGDGDDTLIGGSGAETFFGGKGDDFVDGNIGADTAFLGSGDDRFQWDPGDGSDAVEGDAGQDVLDFNGSNAAEQIELAPNGARARLTRNVAAITMDLDTLEHVSLRTLGGADIVTADDLAGTDVKTFDVDLQAIDGNRRWLGRLGRRSRHQLGRLLEARECRRPRGRGRSRSPDACVRR